MRAIKLKLCKGEQCWSEKFQVREIVWYELEGTLVAIGEPGVRLVGGDAWGYHVWGSESYSFLQGRGEYPLVVLNEKPSDVRRRGRWLTLAFGGRAPEPWSPISVFVKGVRTPARRGVLVAVP